MSVLDWAKREVEIASGQDTTGDCFDGYYKSCCDSALKALESLCGDGHSGMSIGITQSILNRLIEGKPLTAIQDTEDDWIESLGGGNNSYQHKRMSSLFKDVLPDGSIKYTDINRYRCFDLDSKTCFTFGVVGKIVDELYPITMPYYPTATIKVYVRDFLFDIDNGDFDTIGAFYLIDGAGERVELNRFYKETDTGFEAISEEEYKDRESRKIIK